MNSCSCAQCVDACKNDPGRLVPDDLPRIAAFLGCAERELLERYLVKIRAGGKNSHIVFLAPAKRKSGRLLAAPGTFTPEYYERERGRCIFLDECDHCLVHDVKPFECVAYMGCKHTFLGRPYRRTAVEEYFVSRWRRFSWENLRP